MAQPAYKISSFAKFLLKIACELRPEDLESIKLVLAVEGRAGYGKLENLNTAAELFVVLQNLQLLGPRNLSFFEEVFPSMQREDLLEVIETYKSSWEMEPEPEIPIQDIPAGAHALHDVWCDINLSNEGLSWDSESRSSSHSSHSRLSSLSDDEKINAARANKKREKKKKRRRHSSSSSQSTIRKLMSKLKL